MTTARRTELEKKRQQKQARSLAFTLGGAALLVGGGTLAFFLIKGRQPDHTFPLGATIIPQNALLSLTVSTDDGPWRQLGEFGTSDTKARWQEQLKSFETDFLEPFGLTYTADVRPWIGPQLTLAMLSPAQEDVAKVGANATVWVLPLRDGQQARTALNHITNPQVRTYKDVEIKTFQGEKGKSISTVVLEDRLLIATNGNITLNQVIDTYRGAASLAQTPRFQEALNAIEESSAFGKLYVNLPIATAGLLQDTGRNLSKSSLERMQAVQGFGSTISIQGDGLNFKAVSWLKPDAKVQMKATNQPYSLARLLPDDTLMMSAGGSFQQVWQDYSQGTESQLVVPFNPSKIQADLQNSIGIDFEKDFVSWMKGEFVVGVVPTTDKSKQGVGLTLLVKASDRTKANQSFQKLDDAMRDRYNFLVAQSQISNRQVTTWKVPPNLPLASHGWLDDNVAFFTFGAPITNRIVTPASTALMNTDLFRAVTQSSLGPSTGQFFVDLPRTVSVMEKSPLLPKLSPAAMQAAQAIEGIGVTSAVQNAWSTRYDLLVKIKR